MDQYLILDPKLTKPDQLVLENLAADVRFHVKKAGISPTCGSKYSLEVNHKDAEARNEATLSTLDNLNDPTSAHFEPTIFTEVDYDQIKWNRHFNRLVLLPYTRIARSIVRVDTDVVMLTHLLLYFSTTVPSAVFLFWKFSWIHGLLHFVMQVSYMGTYTLMMHQHIHMRGIFKPRFVLFDCIFPYITDPLMGHTWNSYYYHHVKHHHIEGNGPNDLSSTIRYQRDDVFHFLCYVGRFVFFVWIDLPIYFIRKGRPLLAGKVAFWDIGNYGSLYLLFSWQPKPTFCVFLLPFILLRLGLMAGNWGQHAFVDADEPDSDYRSSITLIDVASNRYSYNDGYHTSHHLNPLRHWREHPNSFIKSKHIYASQNALVFHNIDYIMITVKLLMKDYLHLAKCMVPIGEDQLALGLDERVTLLKRHTRRFTEEEIAAKFKLC